MKKIFLTVLALLTVSITLRAEEISPAERITALEIQLDQANSMRDHYSKMAEYSEAELYLANIEIENYRTYTGNLYTNLEESRHVNATLDEFNILKDELIAEQTVTLDHYKNVVVGYEVQISNTIAINSVQEIRINNLEDMNKTLIIVLIVLMIGTILCVTILAMVISHLLKGTKAPAEEKVPTTKPLKAVPKTKKAKPAEVKEEKVDTPSRFTIFITERRAKRDLKRQAVLEKRRAKVLTEKETDEPDTDIKEVNKALTKGVMGKMIATIMKTRLPKKQP